MSERGGKCRERNQAKQDKGRGRREEIVERMRGPDVGIGAGRSGRRQNARDVSAGRDLVETRDDLAPARELAQADQNGREDRAENDAQSRTEQSRLDGVADQEDAAERQRDAADPHHPLRAEALFEIAEIRPARYWRRCICRRRIARRRCVAYQPAAAPARRPAVMLARAQVRFGGSVALGSERRRRATARQISAQACCNPRLGRFRF